MFFYKIGGTYFVCNTISLCFFRLGHSLKWKIQQLDLKKSKQKYEKENAAIEPCYCNLLCVCASALLTSQVEQTIRSVRMHACVTQHKQQLIPRTGGQWVSLLH